MTLEGGGDEDAPGRRGLDLPAGKPVTLKPGGYPSC